MTSSCPWGVGVSVCPSCWGLTCTCQQQLSGLHVEDSGASGWEEPGSRMTTQGLPADQPWLESYSADWCGVSQSALPRACVLLNSERGQPLVCAGVGASVGLIIRYRVFPCAPQCSWHPWLLFPHRAFVSQPGWNTYPVHRLLEPFLQAHLSCCLQTMSHFHCFCSSC